MLMKAINGARMRICGNSTEITIRDSASALKDFRTEFGSYAPLLDQRRGDPSFDELKRRAVFALGMDKADLVLVLHVEALDNVPVKREVRAYPKDEKGLVLAIARWSEEDGLSVHSIN
ncbi:MAG: hypothetical protein QXD77_03240 [Candidatus Aenigmatarchaeota archaeon]